MYGEESARLHIGVFRQIKRPKFLHFVGANAIARDRLNFEDLEIQWTCLVRDDMEFREAVGNQNPVRALREKIDDRGAIKFEERSVDVGALRALPPDRSER